MCRICFVRVDGKSLRSLRELDELRETCYTLIIDSVAQLDRASAF
jgi:hypothetical protein